MVDPFPTFYPGGALGDLTRRVQAIEDAVGTRRAGGPSLLDAVVGQAGMEGLTDQIDSLQQAVSDIGETVTNEGQGLVAIYRSIATGQDYSIGQLVARIAERSDDTFQAQLTIKFVDDLVPIAIRWLNVKGVPIGNFAHLPETIFPLNSIVQLHCYHNIEFFKIFCCGRRGSYRAITLCSRLLESGKRECKRQLGARARIFRARDIYFICSIC